MKACRATLADDLPALTALRGLAATSIAFYHFYLELGLEPGPLHVLRKAYLSVDLFFVLSGFVLVHVYRDEFVCGLARPRLLSFLVKRISRIYPVHLVTLGLFVSVEVAFWLIRSMVISPSELPWFIRSGFLDEASNLWTLVLNLTLIQAWGLSPGLSWNGVSWSVSAEWFAYLLFPLMVNALKLSWVIQVVLGVICVGGALFVMGFHHGFDVTWQIALLRCLSEFCLGMLLRELCARTWACRLLSHDVVFALVCGAALIGMQVELRNDLLLPLIILSVPVAAANTGLFRRLLALPPLQMLGYLSYSIYLLHILVMNLFLSLLQVLFGLSSWQQVAELPLGNFIPVLTFVLVLMVSALMYRTVEVPAQKKLRCWGGMKKLGLGTVERRATRV